MWFLSLSMFLRLTHVVGYINSLLLSHIPLYELYSLFIHFSVAGHLCYFQVLPIMNKTYENSWLSLLVTNVFILLKYLIGVSGRYIF